MISQQLAWLILVQFAIFEGCYCLKIAQNATEEAVAPLNTTLSEQKPLLIERSTSSPEVNRKSIEFSSIPKGNTTVNEPITNNLTNVNQINSEIARIFLEDFHSSTSSTVEEQKISVNYTVIKNCLNVSSENLTCIDQSWNDTVKTNYSMVAEAVGSSESVPPFRLSNSAAIAAGVFLISAVLGYISCVGYRRFLQRKYANSQILIGEEVYDTTDLRNFEI